MIAIVCGPVTKDPDAPKFRKEGLSDTVEGLATPACVMGTVWPATVKLPARVSELGFVVADQLALLPDKYTDAQVTLDVAAGSGALGFSVTDRIPTEAAGPMLMLDGVTV